MLVDFFNVQPVQCIAATWWKFEKAVNELWSDNPTEPNTTWPQSKILKTPFMSKQWHQGFFIWCLPSVYLSLPHEWWMLWWNTAQFEQGIKVDAFNGWWRSTQVSNDLRQQSFTGSFSVFKTRFDIRHDNRTAWKCFAFINWKVLRQTCTKLISWSCQGRDSGIGFCHHWFVLQLIESTNWITDRTIRKCTHHKHWIRLAWVNLVNK